MRPILITPPAAAPVTLDDAKLHARVDGTAEDALIGAYIAGVVDRLDGWHGILGRALEAQTWEIGLDRFPAGAIRLPLGPVAGVTSITWDDAEGVEQVLDPEAYDPDLRDFEGRVIPAAGRDWPVARNAAGAVRVRWVAGTGCPPALKLVILDWVRAIYDTRDVAVPPPAGLGDWIAPFRRVGI